MTDDSEAERIWAETCQIIMVEGRELWSREARACASRMEPTDWGGTIGVSVVAICVTVLLVTFMMRLSR